MQTIFFEPKSKDHAFNRLRLLNEFHLKDKIRKIESANLNIISTKKLELMFTDLLSYQQSIVIGYSFQYLYRAQITSSNLFSRLKHRNANDVSEYGRCNDIKQSMLYCSNCYTTSILETKPQLSDVITILVIDISDFANETHSTPLFILAQDQIKEAIPKSFFLSTDSGVNAKLKLINKYFEKVMLQNIDANEKWRYKKSIALSNACLNSCNNDHLGIVFPSLASKKYGLNFALTPSWFDNVTNQQYKAFRVKIIEQQKAFETKALIIEVANQLNANGEFVFKDISSKNHVIELNKNFYNSYEAIFDRQKKLLTKDSLFYRRYPPPTFIYA